jgi:hypothetical protein
VSGLRMKLIAAGVVGLSSFALVPLVAQEPTRGDVNSDGKVNIGDPIFLLSFVFQGGKAPKCAPTADANHDLRTDISDAITLLTYLFASQTTLPPMTTEELASCADAPTVVRHGRLTDILDPGHGIDGKVQQLSDRTIRIESFYYDGQGVPQVVVFLTRNSGLDKVGYAISPDLARGHPYLDETLVYPIPEDATDEDFQFVAIFCDALPLTYAYARLTDGP